MKSELFTIHAFGRDIQVRLSVDSYVCDNSLAITVEEFVDDEWGPHFEPYGDLTKNLGLPVPKDCAFVKTYSENEGWALEVANKFGKPVGAVVSNGYASFPLYHFDLSKFDK